MSQNKKLLIIYKPGYTWKIKVDIGFHLTLPIETIQSYK